MREIKFRAWDGKKIREVVRIDFNNNLFDLMLKTPTKSAPDHWCLRKLTDTPIMQFTGLHDKNGKEIYEGDICKLFSCNRPIEFKLGSFGYMAELSNEYYEFIHISNRHFNWVNGGSDKIEVIGNIYENPELLESNG